VRGGGGGRGGRGRGVWGGRLAGAPHQGVAAAAQPPAREESGGAGRAAGGGGGRPAPVGPRGGGELGREAPT
jgi:hypothetical protein